MKRGGEGGSNAVVKERETRRRSRGYDEEGEGKTTPTATPA